MKKLRLVHHRRNRISSNKANGRELRQFYVRYADDWIWLTNGSKEIANTVKDKISTFLEQRLGLTLSAKKTLVTDITKDPAKFLGFEIRGTARGPLYRRQLKNKQGTATKKKTNLQRRGGLPVWTTIDKQRLLDRFHLRGMCDKHGFPREIPWLSTLEPNIIIERFNASILGLAQHYTGFIRNNSALTRWIYIQRYSCLKTLAQKYKCSIKKLFKKTRRGLT